MTYTTRTILVVTPFFSPHIGGSQRYMEELYANLLQRHADMAVDVLTYNTRGVETKSMHRGMTVYRIPCWSILKGQFVLPNPFALTAFLLARLNRGYTHVHANTRFFESTWWAWAYAKLIGAKSIVTDHVASYPTHTNSIVRWIAHAIDHTIASWALRRYDVVTATNKATQRFLTHTLHIPHVVLSYGGVDTKAYAPTRTKKRRIDTVAKTFGKNDIVITYVGRLIPSKGIQTLLRAISSLIPTLSKRVYFVIAGAGSEEKTVVKLMNSKRGKGRIFFTGPLGDIQVQTLLQLSDIVVHPSEHSEGLPNSVLEAAATGCFVIATDNAGTKEIIMNKETGTLIPQGNARVFTQAISWAVTHADKRKVMAKNARKHMQKQFPWGKTVETFYERCLSYRHPLAFTNPAARASFSVQNHVSP